MALKIFTGGMSELMENILDNLYNEFDSLYSCALVSRYWCKMTIPILWQDPFSIKQEPLFISNYFSSLDQDEKFALKECGINVKFSNTLFNYAKFLKVFDLCSLEIKVGKWIYSQLAGSKPHASSTYRIINLLFKLFVESGAILHKLALYFSGYEINPEIFCSLGRNELFFSQLQYLYLELLHLNTDNITLLKILAKNTTKISTLKLNNFSSNYRPQVFHTLTCIIKAQEQLKKFHLIGDEGFPAEFHGIVSALEYQKQTLQEIKIDNCDYSTEFKVLKNCENLEIFRIIYCDSKILETSFDKIKSLEIIDSLIDTSNIVQILEKSSSLLQRLKLESSDGKILKESLLLKTLKSFCPSITHLTISYVDFSVQLLELIGNLQKLQFLTLWFTTCDMQKEERKIRIMQFAEILPLTLQYLNLTNAWLNSYIDVLLNNCDAPLKILLINNLDSDKNVKALIEFCIRKSSLNYVGLSRYFGVNDNINKELEGYVKLVPNMHIIKF